jgi:hypothetical protein
MNRVVRHIPFCVVTSAIEEGIFSSLAGILFVRLSPLR